MGLKLFTCNSFKGHYPTGTAAVVLAPSEEEAAALLEKELKNMGLAQSIKPDQMNYCKFSNSKVIILNDGNY